MEILKGFNSGNKNNVRIISIELFASLFIVDETVWFYYLMFHQVLPISFFIIP